MRFCLTGSAWVLVLVIASNFGSSATGSDLSKFLHAAFDNQHDRAPSGAEMNYYANLSRTEGPLESYIQMMSSDLYFNVQCQQNPEIYVTRLHETFAHREPRQDELRYWVNQYWQTGNRNRTNFVRQFCQAYNFQQVPSAPLPYQATFRLPGSQSGVANTLVQKVNLLRGMIQREMGGTILGSAAVDSIATFLTVCEQYRVVLNSQQVTEQQVRVAATDLELAFQKVQSQFRGLPAASAQSQNLLWEIDQLVSATRPAAAVAAPQTIAHPAASSAGQLSTLLRQYCTLLASYQNRGPFYASLYRDVNGLFVQVESLRQLLRTPQRQSDIQHMVTSMLAQSRAIASQVRQSDAGLQRGWWNIQHELDRLASATGCGGDLYATSSHPVVINRPAWNGFPTQVSPGYQLPASNRQVIELADQLAALIDSYVNSLRPIANRNRDVATMISQSLDLKNAVLQLRQRAAQGGFGTQLQYASREINRQYKDVASRTFLKMVGQEPTLNSPVWMQIGQLAAKIDRALQ